MDELRNTHGIKAVTERLLVTGMSATANKNMGVNIIGVDPGTEKEVFQIYKRIDSTSGDFFNLAERNITSLGMGLEQALFDKKVGAVVNFPSNVIESSMKVLNISYFQLFF